MVRFGQSTYRNTRNRVNGSFSDDFLVELQLDQVLVLTSLIFIIVLETFFREMRSGCPEGLFKLMIWYWSIKNVKMNVKKTKILISSEKARKVS